MRKVLLLMFIFNVLSYSPLLAQQNKCYVSVETTGSYEKLTVEAISLTMLRQFVDATVQPTPLGGFSENDCMYRVNVTEQQTGIKVFIFGQKISDYGTSSLRGEPGLEQGVLRAIYKGLDKQTSSICNKYGTVLNDECKSASSGGTDEAATQMGGQQQAPPRPPISPECQPKEGERLPEFCNREPGREEGFGQQPPQRPECRPPRGVRPPKDCPPPPPRNGQQGPRTNRQRGQGPQVDQGRPPRPECRPRRGVRRPKDCPRPPNGRRPRPQRRN